MLYYFILHNKYYILLYYIMLYYIKYIILFVYIFDVVHTHTLYIITVV